MTPPLYAHQALGAAWLAGRARGLLADVPGLGKTRTALAACHSNGHLRPLIVCPAIVQTHWKREADAFGMAPIVHSYDAITRGGLRVRDAIEALGPDALILDECHYLKHATSQRTKVLLGRDGYARNMRPVYALSGTPMPKNPDELWPLLVSMFTPELLKHGIVSHDAYKERFCVTQRRFIRGQWIDKVMAEVRDVAGFKALLADVMLARGLDDVGLDVPALDFQQLRLNTQLGHAPSYFSALADPHTFECVNNALHGDDLASVANDPHVARLRRRIGELKVAPVAELLQSQLAGNSDKVAVFAHHRSVLGSLRELLKEFGVAYVDGDVGGKARDEAIERFQHDPATRVFIGQNLACGTGMDGLQHVTSRAVLVEPDWTATNNVQLGKRVARIGALGTHAVAQMVCLAGTLDEAIVAQHHRETRMAATVGL